MTLQLRSKEALPPLQYTPLHCHSDASLDGAGTVVSLVQRAKEMNLDHLALTDHGTLANAIAFWTACKDAEVKPILGLEAYFLYNAKRHHITLLSMNETGFNNLVQLDTESHVENYHGGYPLVNLEMLEKYREGLFVLTGCASSALYSGDESDAKVYVGELVDAVGRFQVGLETMFIGTHDTWSRPLALSKWANLSPVVTNDTHFPCRHQFHAHQVVTKARRGFTYDSKHLWLKSAEEIMHEGAKYASADEVLLGLRNAYQIGQHVEPFNMVAPPSLPHIDDVEEKLTSALRTALIGDVALHGQKWERLERLRRELGVLKARGFLDYIYILWDIVSWAKKESIYVGPGRGSGGGSYVLYLLGVTGVDPLRYNLVFERFLNPARADYPDVDVDFESDRRQEVMDYAEKRWGTIPIATYACYSHKSAVHDIARILTIPKDLEDPAADAGADSEKFEVFINDKPHALEAYQTMMGQIRHRGKHAAGVIIPNRPVPIERTSGDALAAAWAEGMNTKDLSKAGIVKYDLLGLTALSQLKKMAEFTGIDARAIGWQYDQPEVFDLFCQGDVAGIFQWSGSDGIRDLTMKVAPRNFTDLVTCNALYRPGALDAGTAEKYPEYMASPRKLHERIDKHLESTYGVICYQEQVMAIVAEVMGGDLSQADIARRLISKAAVGDPKWERQIEELRIEFYQKGTKGGFPEDLIFQLWHEIFTHSGYSYNLAHATTYTMISYQMAWYKVNFRPAFTTAVLQYDKTNAQTYILDAVGHDLTIRMPHVNYSAEQYELHDDEIYIPLNDIAFLGDKAAAYILEERSRNGRFESYEDFDKRIPKRVCNGRARGMMERIGAFEGLAGDPGSAIAKYEELAVGNLYETQLEILGYVVPSKTLLGKIQALASKPAGKGKLRFAGFISKVQNKKGKYGEYSVYTLSPSGSWWTRDPKEICKTGAFVSGTKNLYGKSTDARVYRLGAAA